MSLCAKEGRAHMVQARHGQTLLLPLMHSQTPGKAVCGFCLKFCVLRYWCQISHRERAGNSCNRRKNTSRPIVKEVSTGQYTFFGASQPQLIDSIHCHNLSQLIH